MTAPEPPVGSLLQIWVAPTTAGPMTRLPSVQALPGLGLDGDRYALGLGTWAEWPDLEKQVTLIDRDDVAVVAAETGSPLSPGDTRRNLVTTGVALPDLVGRWFAVGEALLFGMKRCPPCTHLERMTGVRLIKPMARRGGINAAVFGAGRISEGDAVHPMTDEEAGRRGAPVTGPDRPVPRRI